MLEEKVDPQCGSHQHKQEGIDTYRFRNKSNRSGPIELALNYIVDCSSCVTNFKSTCLNASNSGWTNNNLANQEQLNKFFHVIL